MASIKKEVNGDGTTSFRVRVRLKGYPTQSASFARKTDADRWAKSTEAAMQEGRHFGINEAKKRTLSELIARYSERVLPHKALSTARVQKAQLEWWQQQIGPMTLASITSGIVADCTERLIASGNKNATAVRYLAVLTHCFNYGVKELEWLKENCVLRVKKPKEPRGIVRFLTDDERESLLAACKKSSNHLLYPAVLIALSTGMRLSEQFDLTWKDVDLVAGKAILRDTKNGETRAVPITGPAFSELQTLAKFRQLRNDHVFPSATTSGPIDLRKAFAAALKEAGIENFRWHDLRHTFASYLAMNGATPSVLMDAMGHKTLSMVKRYAHLSEGHISNQVASMTAKIFGEVA